MRSSTNESPDWTLACSSTVLARHLAYAQRERMNYTQRTEDVYVLLLANTLRKPSQSVR